MNDQKSIENQDIEQHTLRSQVVADLGHLMARWWLDRRGKDGQELCKNNASVRPTK